MVPHGIGMVGCHAAPSKWGRVTCENLLIAGVFLEGEVTSFDLKLPLFRPDTHSAKNKRESYA